ncbi:MAG: Tn3 family transposase [Actinomycetota bacterium]|nr:Tn3 family transposase [Actinomycetota bacterium]
MASGVLSQSDLDRLRGWPSEVGRSDLVEYFALDVGDLRWVRSHRGSATRLGLGVQLCALRFLGFVPADLASTPGEVTQRLAERIGIGVSALDRYVDEVDGRLRRLHVASVVERAGWRSCGRAERKALGDWLVVRALEHDDAPLLFAQALEHLRAERIVRPGLDRLGREVADARTVADREGHWRLRPQLGPSRCAQLDALMAKDAELGMAPLTWVNKGAPSSSPETIKAEVAKLGYLRERGADRIDLSAVPPERTRQLAGVGRRSTPKALRAMLPERRHPILLATLAGAYTSILDEVVEMFDQSLAATSSRARSVLAGRQLAVAEANAGRLELLDEILDVALDPERDDAGVGAGVRSLGPERLASARRADDERLPRDGGHLALIEARYSHVRSFAPQALSVLSLRPGGTGEAYEAAKLLQAMNAEGCRHVPPDAPVGFVPTRWQSYLAAARAAGNENAYRHYWELCALYTLQGALRSGEVWVEGSRRFGNVASYLIPAAQWPDRRAEVAELCGLAGTFAERLASIDADYDRHLGELEALLADGDGSVGVDGAGQLHLRPLAAEVVAPEVQAAKDAILARLPMVPLAEAIIDVDHVTHFSDRLTHAGGGTPRAPALEHRRNLYAALLAQACNFGTTRMAELTGIPADTLDWYVKWYLRDEPRLEAANAAVVNEHHRQPFSGHWGGGTLSSSDGLRLPMRGKSLTARALSRYFLDQGVTTYWHVSDQHSTYGTQIIVSTDRDGLYVLDEILGNTTELPIVEHTTDSHGQLLATFALFDLVGKQLSPRIAKITDKPLWRPHPPSHYTCWPLAGPLLSGHAQTGLIDEQWDELARVAGSLKLGHVSASLLVARLQAGSRQHPLAKALVEYGKLLRSLHALRWFTDEAFRRRIGRQLNKGESLNDLRRFIAYANAGKEKYRRHDDQTAQAHCVTLMVNICILSTTWYLQDAAEAQRADGHDVTDEVIAHISPGHFEALNPYGTHNIDVAAVLGRNHRRPLRRPAGP